MLRFRTKNLRTPGSETIEDVAIPISAIEEMKATSFSDVSHMSGVQAQVSVKGKDGMVYWSMDSLEELIAKVETPYIGGHA